MPYPLLKLFTKYTKKVTKFGLEVLTGKALSFWLEFIDKTGEKVFCLQTQIKLLSLALLYSVDLFINKLKTKFNYLFLQNDFKYKKNSQLLLKKFPRKSYIKCLQTFYLSARKSNGRGRSVITRQNCKSWQQNLS